MILPETPLFSLVSRGWRYRYITAFPAHHNIPSRESSNIHIQTYQSQTLSVYSGHLSSVGAATSGTRSLSSRAADSCLSFHHIHHLVLLHFLHLLLVTEARCDCLVLLVGLLVIIIKKGAWILLLLPPPLLASPVLLLLRDQLGEQTEGD